MQVAESGRKMPFPDGWGCVVLLVHNFTHLWVKVFPGLPNTSLEVTPPALTAPRPHLCFSLVLTTHCPIPSVTALVTAPPCNC